ncbi:MAG: transposase zinc-binding domain-containing protein [Nannocystaceae bacterium]|nr:transposase zinc-binding domain-containing protein [bacterium]
MAGCHARAQYVPRSTQDSGALALVREHWPSFRVRLEERAGSLPAFVRDELESFITCGDFEHGFLVAQCQRCGDSLRVPFACKSRGICPSCMGRRMAETAALLVEHRLPAVPWRQWVLSFPGPLAVRLGYDRALLGRVCQRFASRVMQTLRRLTKRTHGLASSAALHPGVLIVVQRFRNDLGLFVHLHALVNDGCFDASDPNEPRFRPIAGLADAHLVHTLQRVHADFAALEPDHDDDGDDEVDAAIAACVQLALPLRPATPSPPESAPASPLLVTAVGMQLHAAVTVDGRDRSRLERLCRYLLRPPFALDTVQRTADGQIRVHFKKPTRSGASYAQMTPDTFLPSSTRSSAPPPLIASPG